MGVYAGAFSTQQSAFSGNVDCREPVVGRPSDRPLAQGRQARSLVKTKPYASASASATCVDSRRNWPLIARAQNLVPFSSIHDLASPCAGIRKDELYAGGNRRVKFCKPFTTETRGHGEKQNQSRILADYQGSIQ